MATKAPQVLRMTIEELLALPVSVDVPTAGRAFGMHRDTAYTAAREGSFPCPVLRVGSRYVVPRAGILRALGIEQSPAA